jgi:hypothetical protein
VCSSPLPPPLYHQKTFSHLSPPTQPTSPADTFTATNKCQYPSTGTKAEAFDAFFGKDGGAAKHLSHFASVLGDKKSFTSKLTAGEIAVVAIIHILATLEPLENLLQSFPSLAAFYKYGRKGDAGWLLGRSPCLFVCLSVQLV